MKIRVFIDNTIDDKVYLDKDIITFYFNNENNYVEFRANFSLNKEFNDEYEDNILFKNIVENMDISQFKKLFKRIKPVIIYKNYDEDIFNIKVPVIIDLSNESFEQKLAILTNPNNKGTNLFFKDEFTTGEYITLEEMIHMYQTVLYDSETILRNNYSPLEAIYYIYSKYKHRIYQKEDKNEKEATSRSLNQIIKGNKIVCVGYSNYLSAIGSILKMAITSLSWTNKNNPEMGHQENIAIINDPKYNIKGVFAVDITWDSKKNEHDLKYMKNIRHFLIPIKIDTEEKNIVDLENGSDNYYHNIFDCFKRLKRLEELNAPDYILDNAKELLRAKINYINKILELPELNKEYNPDEEIAKIKNLGNTLIPLDVLESVINTVTPMAEENLNETIKSSYHFYCLSPEKKLLYAIFNTTR